MRTELDVKTIDDIANAVFYRFGDCENDLNFRLALEQRLTGSTAVPFGLDKLNTDDAASYLGLQAETLRANVKRRSLDLPKPYCYGKKLFWRRSELDAWVERQRQGAPSAGRAE